jgi:hypothetical protein
MLSSFCFFKIWVRAAISALILLAFPTKFAEEKPRGFTFRGDTWDGVDFSSSAFRRTVGSRLMNLWLDLKQIVSTIQFEECEDNIIWQFDSSGQYSI